MNYFYAGRHVSLHLLAQSTLVWMQTCLGKQKMLVVQGCIPRIPRVMGTFFGGKIKGCDIRKRFVLYRPSAAPIKRHLLVFAVTQESMPTLSG
jgi:hypothetical protein